MGTHHQGGEYSDVTQSESVRAGSHSPVVTGSPAFAGDDTKKNHGLFNCRSRSITAGGLW